MIFSNLCLQLLTSWHCALATRAAASCGTATCSGGWARATVYSAGVETHGLNPRAVQVMAEDGVDISHHTSNPVDEYAAVPFAYVLTVCDHANEVCPGFTSSAKRLHHSFPDPARATGTEAEILQQFRAVRDQAKAYAEAFAHQYFPA